MRRATTVAALLALLSASAAGAAVRWFHSPSGNIQCQVSTGGVRGTAAFCQTFSPPRTATLHKNGHTTLCGARCVGNGPENATTLRYGHSISVGPFRCTSRRSGIRCVVRRSGHGFKISRQRITRF